MKRLLHLMLVIGLILPPALCGASYLIEFKSGSKFVTSHYWTAGNLVNFYSRGGVMGVPKTMIKQISNTDESPQPEIETQPEVKTKETPPEPKAKKDIDVEALKKKKTELEDKVRLAEEVFKQAAVKGNNTEKKAAIQEFLKHRNAFVQYRKEILEQNNNELPEWW